MNCFFHNETQAVSQCRNNCGKFLCTDCYNINNGYCFNCLHELVVQNERLTQESKRIAKNDIIWFLVVGLFFGLGFGSMMSFGDSAMFLILSLAYTYIFGSIPITLRWLWRNGWIVWGIVLLFICPFIALYVLCQDISILKKRKK